MILSLVKLILYHVNFVTEVVWRMAMEELDAIEDNQTWTLIELPSGGMP
jgi:hypothetical protein